MKRIIGIILTVMLLVSMAVTAAAEPNTDLSGEISIWVWGDYEEKGAMDFNQYYPNIKVNYVFIAQDEYPTKVQSAIVSGLGAARRRAARDDSPRDVPVLRCLGEARC